MVDKMTEIKISVIVPVYKIEEKLLRKCLSSLMNQKSKDVEFIIVDDGSPDNCGTICDEYENLDKRFQVIHTSNQGVSNARNVGFNNSHGKYIMYVDGDDYIEENTCESCSQKMEEANVDLLLFGYRTSTNHTKVNQAEDLLRLNDNELQQLRSSIVSGVECFPGYFVGSPWGKVYKREIIEKNDLQFVYGLKKCQDRVFVFDYATHVNSVALYPFIGYNYENNPSSVTRKYNKEISYILHNVEQEFYKRIRKQNNALDYKEPFYTMCLNFLYTILQLDILNDQNKDSLLNKKRELVIICNEKPYSSALKKGRVNGLGKRKSLTINLIRKKMYLLVVILRNKVMYK
jgi:glycosyltransferase involved in cell wall biosynthesis